MLENTTVTLPLKDFDELRAKHAEYKRMASRIASCFDYTCKRYPEPEECNDCTGETDCPDCEVYRNNPQYGEKLTVDVERLIRVAKEYALYGKEVETDLDVIPVEYKAGRVDE